MVLAWFALGNRQTSPEGRGAEGTDQPAFGVGAADTRHALEIVAAGAKPLPDLLDTVKAILAVGGGVLFLVVLAELGEMAFKDGMELVAPTGNVPVRRHARDRDYQAHIDIYWGKVLPASDRGTGIGRHIPWRIHRTPSRSFGSRTAS